MSLLKFLKGTLIRETRHLKAANLRKTDLFQVQFQQKCPLRTAVIRKPPIHALSPPSHQTTQNDRPKKFSAKLAYQAL